MSTDKPGDKSGDIKKASKHIRITSHPGQQGPSGAPAINWGAGTAAERGPVIGTTTKRSQRNVIGTHSGSYGIYRALAVATGNLVQGHRADLTNTSPTDLIGPNPQWGDASKMVSIDPWGASVADVFSDYIAQGYDVRPTIAVTKAHIDLPEIHHAKAFNRLIPDNRVLLENGSAVVTKIAIEPVWWLPGVAKRFDVSESDLRRILFEETGGMYPELVTRSDLEVFLPPIGGQTLYIFGNPRDLANPSVTLTARVHDECNGSDVFGSDICTCRPYLTGMHPRCTARWRRTDRLQPKGRPRTRRSYQISGLQRPQTAGGWRQRRQVFFAHRMCRWRTGHALSGNDAGCSALAWRRKNSSPGEHE
jgi:GTP cyclohydrolase II